MKDSVRPRLYIKDALIAVGTLVSVGLLIATLTRDGARPLPADARRFLSEHVYNEEHPPLFPLLTSDYYGFFFATLGLMVAAGGGIGGGGILVPIYIIIMGFTPKHAIPLSNITVFGGAVANTLLNARKRHPLADRPLVDWDLILVMEPLTIAGALLGAFLNKLLPEELLTLLLVALLSFTSYTSLRKAVKMYNRETQLLRQATGVRPDGTKESELARIAATEQEEGLSDRLLDHVDENDEQGRVEEYKDEPKDAESSPSPEESMEPAGPLPEVPKVPLDPPQDDDEEDMNVVDLEEAEESAALQRILDEEREMPILNVKILVALFVVVLAMNLLKGGGAFPSPLGIRCGSTSFWLANAVMLGWIVAISIYVREYLVQRHQRKVSAGYRFVEGDIRWTRRATLLYPLVCCLAGFFAGMFGVGGGIVKGPLMLAMGVHPAVSSASSACMILFTSFTATTSFIVFGLLVSDYAIICVCIGFCATLAGQVGLSYLMKKAQRNSYIAFSIGGVVLLSAILMTFQSVLSLASGERHQAGGICGHDS